MKDFLKKEKQLFAEFGKQSKILLAATVFFVLVTYGLKIFYLDYSIDTEAILNDYSEQLKDWLSVNRLGLVFTKYLLFHQRFNPFVANFLTFFTFTMVCVFLCFLVQRILNNYAGKIGITIISILFLTDPIFAEQFNFTLQNFEVALAIFFLVISLLFSYYYICTNYIIFTVPPILLCIWSFLTYQSLYSFYIAGSVISIILILYKDQKENQVKSYKSYFIIIMKYLLIFIVSFVLSQLVAFVYTRAAGIPSSSYLTRQILWGKLPASKILNMIGNQIDSVIFAKSIFYNYGFLFSIIIAMLILVRKLFLKSKLVVLEFLCLICLYLTPFILTMLLGQGEPIRAQMPALEFVIAFNFYYIYLHVNNKLLQKLFVALCVLIAINQSYVAANLLFSEHMKYEEDVTMANRINFQLDSLGVGDRKNYSLIILGKHQPENVLTIKGETLGYSFFEWDLGTEQGASDRVVTFMRTIGYPFNKPTNQQLKFAHSIENQMTVWPDKNSIKVENNFVIVKLSN